MIVNKISDCELEFITTAVVIKNRQGIKNELCQLQSELLTYEDHIKGIKNQITEIEVYIELLPEIKGDK